LLTHVLQHTSGLCPERGGYGQFEHGRNRWLDYEDWVLGHDLRWKRTRGVYFPPGRVDEFDGDPYWKGYSSVGFAHLGLVFANLYKIPASDLLQSKLLTPIGISDIKFVNPPNPEVEWFTAGGLAMTPRDFARLAYLFLNNGKWGDQQIIPESWMKEIQQGSKYPNFLTNQDYYFGKRYPRDMIRISGAGGNFAYIIPSMDLIALHTDRFPDAVQQAVEQQFLSLLFDAILNHRT